MRPSPIDQLIHDKTGGGPYVCLLGSFHDRYWLHRSIQDLVERELPGFACLRADDLEGAGLGLQEKVHRMIDLADLVLADITAEPSGEANRNVLYEVGYAAGREKETILVVDGKTNVPTDLKDREVLVHDGAREGVERFEKALAEHLRTRIVNSSALLRDMLQVRRDADHFILASPLYPDDGSRVHGQKFDTRTFGDNVGILGLLSALGAVLGEAGKVELVSAVYSDPGLVEAPLNLYAIGSGRANPRTPALLERLQAGGPVRWSFDAAPGREEESNPPVCLYRDEGGARKPWEGKKDDPDLRVYVRDFGLVVRGPHPHHPDRSALVLAGAHSLGTAAACMAATRSRLVRDLARALPVGARLEDPSLSFWALVEGRANDDDGMLDEGGVTVLEAGLYG